LDEQGEEEEEEEQEGADFDEQSMLQRLANTSSPLATVNFQFIPRRGSLGLEEVKFRQWVMRHLLWNGDMTQMPIEILSSPLLSQFTTTDEQEASYLFRNWVMRQVPLPQQQQDRSTAFVQWIKKHILGDRTELDYRRKMRQALNFPLQEISQQETSAYRTRVFRVLGEQNRFHSTMLSGFEREFDFPDPYYDIDNDTDEEDELEEYIPSIHDVIGYDEEDEEDTLDTSDEDDDAGTFTETEGLDGLSDTSESSGIAHLLPVSSYNTLK
jgi:hypothetical protein